MKKGFTLIELLVVVLIIGILAAVAVPQYQKAVLKSHYTQLQVVCKSLADAQKVYYMENGSWAEKFSDLDVELPAGASLRPAETEANGPGKFYWLIWLNNAKTSGTIIGAYDNRVTLLINFPSGSRACRAKENDTLANDLCKNMRGTYTATYDGWKSYKLP